MGEWVDGLRFLGKGRSNNALVRRGGTTRDSLKSPGNRPSFSTVTENDISNGALNGECCIYARIPFEEYQ